MKRSDELITPDTKVAALLERYPVLEETLINTVPAFSALRNPFLRKTVARVTSLQQAAKVGGVDVVDLVNSLRKVVGQETLGNIFYDEELAIPFSSSELDAWKMRVTKSLDVRPLLEQGIHPKDMIREAAESLSGQECLEFVTGFIPTPLIELLQQQGFAVKVFVASPAEVRTYVVRG